MPLPGGPTDKFGNRYEGRWTVNCMVDVMDEQADSIRLEPPGVEGEGVEFWIQRGDVREYHQVKRQHSASGRWTLKDLGHGHVLAHFWEKLREPKASCIFVSFHAAYQLAELAERAKGAASWEEFDQVFLKSDIQSGAFDELCRQWGECPRQSAFEALKRVHVKTIGEDTLQVLLESRLAALVEGDSGTVVDILAQLALDVVHQELTAQDIWHHLEARDLRRRQWGKDSRVLAAVEAANERYLSPLCDVAWATIGRAA